MTTVLLSQPRRKTAGVLETLLIAGQAAGFSILPGLLLWRGAEDPLMWVIGIPGVVVAIVGALLVVWRVAGREIVMVDAGTLVARAEVGPVGLTRTIPLHEVTETRLVPCGRTEMQNNFFGVGHAGLLVRSRHSHIRCGLGLTGQPLEDLAGRVRTAALEFGAGEQAVSGLLRSSEKTGS